MMRSLILVLAMITCSAHADRQSKAIELATKHPKVVGEYQTVTVGMVSALTGAIDEFHKDDQRLIRQPLIDHLVDFVFFITCDSLLSYYGVTKESKSDQSDRIAAIDPIMLEAGYSNREAQDVFKILDPVTLDVEVNECLPYVNKDI